MSIKFGIIGVGRIGTRHAKHIDHHPETELLAVYDIKRDRCEELQKTYPHIQIYDSLNDLLSHPGIDIVNVCTPNGDHHVSSIAALEANKHVLVEKPMSIKKIHCEDMIQTAYDQDKYLFVVKQNRFNPPVQQVKSLMKDKKLGKIYSVVVNCFWNRNERYYRESDWKGKLDMDGGTLYTQFSHFVDIAYYLFGDMVVKGAIMDNCNHEGLIEFEDTGHVIFDLRKHDAMGVLNFTTSCYEKNMEGSITIIAENATIKIGGQYLNTIEYQTGENLDLPNIEITERANDYGYYKGSMSNHDKVIDNIVKTLQGKEKFMTNAYEGLKVVEIIENMYAAAGAR